MEKEVPYRYLKQQNTFDSEKIQFLAEKVSSSSLLSYKPTKNEQKKAASYKNVT